MIISILHRSEEHTSELQSLRRISYAVFCLKKATILEENVRLTKELAKLTSSKGKMSLDDILSKQRSPHNQGGLGYVPYATKKKKNKKKNTVSSSLTNMTTFVKEGEKSQVSSSSTMAGVSGVSRPESPGKPESPARKTGVSAPSHNDFAGKYKIGRASCRERVSSPV